MPSDKMGFEVARTMRASSLGWAADGALPAGELATGADDAQAASSPGSTIRLRRRITPNYGAMVVGRATHASYGMRTSMRALTRLLIVSSIVLGCTDRAVTPPASDSAAVTPPVGLVQIAQTAFHPGMGLTPGDSVQLTALALRQPDRVVLTDRVATWQMYRPDAWLVFYDPTGTTYALAQPVLAPPPADSFPGTVDANGMFRALRPGRAAIAATVEGVVGVTWVAVMGPPPFPAAGGTWDITTAASDTSPYFWTGTMVVWDTMHVYNTYNKQILAQGTFRRCANDGTDCTGAMDFPQQVELADSAGIIHADFKGAYQIVSVSLRMSGDQAAGTLWQANNLPSPPITAITAVRRP
jgi:hypothetical protein